MLTAPVLKILIIAQFIFSCLFLQAAFAEQKPVLTGRVIDKDGTALQGALVFIYDSPDIRRPVDLVSSQTGEDGLFRMELPAGSYWVVARRKVAGRFGLGPLMPGNKFSGEPTEITVANGQELTIDFTVLDIMEFARQKKKVREDCVRIKGRLVDENGRPVSMAYAMANTQEKAPAIPDYVSGWTDEDGYFTLYLPGGKYYLGYATAFPPGKKYVMDRTVAAQKDTADIEIVVRSE